MVGLGLAACGDKGRGHEPGPLGIVRAEVVDGAARELRVTVLGGSCSRIESTDVMETTSAVRIAVQGGANPGCEEKDDRGVLLDTTVALAAPLAGREVVDENCPHPRPGEAAEGACGLPLEVVRTAE